MRIKSGVVIFFPTEIHRDLWTRVWEIVDVASIEIFGVEATLTSFLEGTHSRNSLHYWRTPVVRDLLGSKPTMGACDFRTRSWIHQPHKLHRFRRRIKALLDEVPLTQGKFDVILEWAPPHLHLEFDPKEPSS